MSDLSHDASAQGGFLRVIGLFVLGVLAVLVALYFYDADVKRAGDGALDQARAYKHTILTDYSRFYECMRGAGTTTTAAVESPKPDAAGDGGGQARASASDAASPIVVYPPYPDYPAYPPYPGGPASLRQSAEPTQPGPTAQMPQQQAQPVGPGYPSYSTTYSRPSEYLQQGAGQAPAGMPQGSGMQPPPPGLGMEQGPGMPTGPGMQPGPGMEQGSGMQPGPGMQTGPGMQAGPAMPPWPGMQQGPGMQAGPAMPAGPGMPQWPMQQGPGMQQQGRGMQQGPGMQAGPAMPAGAGMPPWSMQQGPGMQQQGPPGMQPQPPAAVPPGYQAYGPPPNWQAQRMPPGRQGSPYGEGYGGSYPRPYGGPPPYGGSPYGRPPYGGGGYSGPYIPPVTAQSGPAAMGGMRGTMPIPQTPLAEGMGSDMPPTAISPVQPPAVSSPQTEVVAVAPSVSMAAVVPELGQSAASGTDDGKLPLDPQIVSARQAYARKQYQDAIGIYRVYISRHKDNASAFGELGNVLLAAGRPQEAAQAYYEASSRLIDMGQPGSVYLLLPHIEQQDPLLAAVLTRRLASLPRAFN